MHKYPFIILFVIIIGSVYLVLFSDTHPTPPQRDREPTNEHPTIPAHTEFTASFLIFIHGLKRNFAAEMYHNLSDEVYITKENPAIIHVNAPNITWRSFFSTLPMGISDTCLTTGTGQTFCNGTNGNLRFFINGKETPTILEEEILPHDRLLVTFGDSTMATISAQISQIPDPTASSSALSPQAEE